MEIADMNKWALGIREKLIGKMNYASRIADQLDFIPYTVENGRFRKTSIDWWTNGFWGAMMWKMYRLSGQESFRASAVRSEEMMDAALYDFEKLHHDVGFMWLIQSGVRYAMEGNRDSYRRTLYCANMLAGRFNPNGFIRAWNGEENTGVAIIDCMMNIPLLYWASRQTGDPRYKLIAMRHADTAMKYFVRDDGSCNHIVRFDPATGEYLDNPAGQGYASGSSWSRGQSWALYGFTLSYRCTGKQEYLDTAKRVAHYFISQIDPNGLVRCDFRQPKEPEVLDNAASAIAACGLMELAEFVPEYEKDVYLAQAFRMLTALEKECADWTENTPAILQKCTGSYHNTDHHITMNYADYYFIEAVGRLLGENFNFWTPDCPQEDWHCTD